MPAAENEARLRNALADARVSVRDFDAILAAARELMAQAWDAGAEHMALQERILPDRAANPHRRSADAE